MPANIGARSDNPSSTPSIPHGSSSKKKAGLALWGSDRWAKDTQARSRRNTGSSWNRLLGARREATQDMSWATVRMLGVRSSTSARWGPFTTSRWSAPWSASQLGAWWSADSRNSRV